MPVVNIKVGPIHLVIDRELNEVEWRTFFNAVNLLRGQFISQWELGEAQLEFARRAVNESESVTIATHKLPDDDYSRHAFGSWEHFSGLAAANGCAVRKCTDSHWQMCKDQSSLNYYPTTGKAHIQKLGAVWKSKRVTNKSQLLEMVECL